ncbi:unnamed protein product [Alternaria alternata]
MANKPDAPVLVTDFADREVRQLDFSDTKLLIGGLLPWIILVTAVFHLLDAPGHASGHLCGLARTTTNTFMLFTGDVYHHASQIRPSVSVPLPEYVNVPNLIPNPLPAKQLAQIAPSRCCSAPLLQPGKVNSDLSTAMRTINAVRGFDDQDNVFLVAAHDHTVSAVIDTFPRSANQWKQRRVERADKVAVPEGLQEALNLVA